MNGQRMKQNKRIAQENWLFSFKYHTNKITMMNQEVTCLILKVEYDKQENKLYCPKTKTFTCQEIWFSLWSFHDEKVKDIQL